MVCYAFIKIDGIPGESCWDDEHQGWIDVLSYSHSVSQPFSATVSSSGDATTERVNFGRFNITKFPDKATPEIFEACCTGKHIKEVIFEVCRTLGDGKRHKYLEIRMEQVLIADHSHAFNEKGDKDSHLPVERVAFSPGRFKIIYHQQEFKDGTVTLTESFGAGWDSIAHESIGHT